MQRFNDRRGSGRGGGFGGRGRSFGGGFREDRGGFDDTPKPVKVGEEYDIEVSEVGAKGDGIARIKNFVVFVNNVKQGEKARIQIKEVRNRFAIGEKIGEAKGEVKSESKAEPSAEGESSETVKSQDSDEAPEEEQDEEEE